MSENTTTKITNKQFFIERLYKPIMGEQEIVLTEFENFMETQSINNKILLLCYEEKYTNHEISKFFPDSKEETLKVTISKLKTDIKLKVADIKSTTKLFTLHQKKGLSTLIKMAANFTRDCEYISENIKNASSNDKDSKKIIKMCHEFLDNEENNKIIHNIIDSDGLKYLSISLEDEYLDLKLREEILEHPLETIDIFEETLKTITKKFDFEEEIKIRFRDLPKADTLEINKRRKSHINKLIQMNGIIKRKTRPQPRVKKINYLCSNPSCNFSEEIMKVPQCQQKLTLLKECPKCKSGVELIEEEQVDTQLLILEEDIASMETTKTNVDSIKCVLQDDLTEWKKEEQNDVGINVSVIGILRTESKTTKGGADSIDKTYYIEVNNIINDEKLNDIILTKEDIKQIKEFSKNKNPLQIAHKNFMPEIIGNEDVKKTLLLQLFGGVSEYGSRAEPHILLLGDPGVGKSQMTKLQASYAKKSMYSSGSGSSKAGLTGAVLKDELTGDYVLEAGAMAKANGGIVAIDEMDKMSSDDTGVMHEALEHGEATINKANIHTKVCCKCSVIASANPKFGKFLEGKPISSQIEFPPALLSRFDFIFILKDIPNREKDSKLAKHVLSAFTKTRKEVEYDVTFFKKYIHYCKENFKPIMNQEASNYLKEKYADVRNNEYEEERTSFGLRQLHGWARFSYAIAKANFSNEVKLEHAQEAIKIFESCWGKISPEQIEDITISQTNNKPSDGKIYDLILELLSKNKQMTKKQLEKIFEKDIKQLNKVLKLLKSEKKIFEPIQFTYKIAGGEQ